MPGSKRSLVGRRDPQGFYVIIAKGEALSALAGLEGMVTEKVGDTVILKTKSRRVALKLHAFLSSKGLLMEFPSK